MCETQLMQENANIIELDFISSYIILNENLFTLFN